MVAAQTIIIIPMASRSDGEYDEEDGGEYRALLPDGSSSMYESLGQPSPTNKSTNKSGRDEEGGGDFQQLGAFISSPGGGRHALDLSPHDMVRAGASGLYLKNLTEGTSLPGTTFNLINSILGAGMLALPASLRLNGALVGMLAIVLVAMLSDYSCGLILHVVDYSKKRGKWAFGDVGELVLGSLSRFCRTLFQNERTATARILIPAECPATS